MPDGTVQVLSSVVHSQIADHAPFGGVVPEIAARSHVEAIAGTARRAIEQSGVDFDGLDAVAANRKVRAELERAAKARGFEFLAPPLAYCTDNAAMIALAGAERLALGLVSDIDVAARPRWPLDEATALADPLYKTGRKGAKA